MAAEYGLLVFFTPVTRLAVQNRQVFLTLSALRDQCIYCRSKEGPGLSQGLL
jgi:hypothetical protein